MVPVSMNLALLHRVTTCLDLQFAATPRQMSQNDAFYNVQLQIINSFTVMWRWHPSVIAKFLVLLME